MHGLTRGADDKYMAEIWWHWRETSQQTEKTNFRLSSRRLFLLYCPIAEFRFYYMTKPRLLLVDDDKDALDGLINILKRDGYQVVGVLSGYEALNSLSKKSFDIVITDLNMPGMHGFTLIHEVRKRKEPIAIVIVTANSSAKSVMDAERSAEYDYFLKKPVNIEELKSILEKLWEKQRVIAQNQVLARRSLKPMKQGEEV
jgi:DNA-binding NtrC family response regulator